jgi:hypothetical protein
MIGFLIIRLHGSPHDLTAWAVIWILFEILVLVGFLLIGIASFKRTSDEMRSEAGGYHIYFPPTVNVIVTINLATFLPT